MLRAYLHSSKTSKGEASCRVADGAPRISHMFFVDDSYIFGRATPQEADNLLNLLETYEKASGQKVNIEKSSIFLAITLVWRHGLKCVGGCKWRRPQTRAHIWDFQTYWEERNQSCLVSLKRKSGRKFRTRKTKYYQKQEKKFSSRQWSKLYPIMR